MADGDIILYTTNDGKAEVSLTEMHGTVWLSQAGIADLYQTTVSNINKHIKGILEDGEQGEGTVEHRSIVRQEGPRRVRRMVANYSLPMVLAVGYRVRTPRAIQFRQWATGVLAEFLTKGFVMNDERLKEPGGWDYFDELLARIRDIRASEKRFYQKIRDLFALSQDYRDNEMAAQEFFAEVQNKMLHGVTGQTAAELIVARADPTQPHMNLTTWKGAQVRKQDVVIAKNYLRDDEVATLNRIVTMFLDFAEDRVEQRRQLTLDDWRANVDRFLAFNERPVLTGKGRISHERMVGIAHQRYEEFDARRRAEDAIRADLEDMAALENVEKQMVTVKKTKLDKRT